MLSPASGARGDDASGRIVRTAVRFTRSVRETEVIGELSGAASLGFFIAPDFPVGAIDESLGVSRRGLGILACRSPQSVHPVRMVRLQIVGNFTGPLVALLSGRQVGTKPFHLLQFSERGSSPTRTLVL